MTTSSDREQRAAVADLIDDRLREFAARAADTIMTTIEGYRGGDVALRGDVEAHCCDAYTAFVAALRRGTDADADDFETTADRASRRVAQGISLADFLRAFRIVQGSLWDDIRAVAATDPQIAQAAPNVVATLMQTFEVGSVGAASSYLEAQQYAVADMDRLRRDLVEDLLDGRVPTAPTRVGLLRAAGLEGHASFVCVLGIPVIPPDHPRSDEPRLRAASLLIRDELGRQAAGLLSLRHDQLIALLPVPRAGLAAVVDPLTTAADRLDQADIPMRLGVSTPHNRLDDVPTAHHEAIIACRALPGPGAQRLGALRPTDYLTLLDDPTARKLIRPSVRKFITEDRADGSLLIDTLRQYATGDLNARAVAESMHLHVNSVYYRLDRVTDRTGLDMRTYDGVEELLTAIRLLAPDRRPDR